MIFFSKKINNAFKIFLNSLYFTLLAVLFYFFLAVLLAFIPVHSDFKEPKEGTEIFVSTNGVHTNIILPARSKIFNWNKYLALDKEFQYFEFGWGDQDFYMNTPTWAELKWSTAFKAVFLPSKTIMQVSGFNEKPKVGEQNIKLVLNDEQFQEISNYVANSFKYNSENQLIKIIPNNKHSFKAGFYAANGTYSLFKTCNNWTNVGLKQAGVKNALWAPFDKSVLYHIKK